MTASSKEPSCATCALRRRAKDKPNGFWAWLWRWHAGWCPGWKRYQAWLAAQEK